MEKCCEYCVEKAQLINGACIDCYEFFKDASDAMELEQEQRGRDCEIVYFLNEFNGWSR